jgi:hypothetical protein
MSPAETYQRLRPLMFSIAYRMLGSVSEAEDIVQEAFLRYHAAQARQAGIGSPKAYLSAVMAEIAPAPAAARHGAMSHACVDARAAPAARAPDRTRVTGGLPGLSGSKRPIRTVRRVSLWSRRQAKDCGQRHGGLSAAGGQVWTGCSVAAH